MGAIGLRDDIKNYVNIADERLLKVVKAVMESYWDEETVAFTVDGKPLTKKCMRKNYKTEFWKFRIMKLFHKKF